MTEQRAGTRSTTARGIRGTIPRSAWCATVLALVALVGCGDESEPFPGVPSEDGTPEDAPGYAPTEGNSPGSTEVPPPGPDQPHQDSSRPG